MRSEEEKIAVVTIGEAGKKTVKKLKESGITGFVEYNENCVVEELFGKKFCFIIGETVYQNEKLIEEIRKRVPLMIITKENIVEGSFEDVAYELVSEVLLATNEETLIGIDIEEISEFLSDTNQTRILYRTLEKDTDIEEAVQDMIKDISDIQDYKIYVNFHGDIDLVSINRGLDAFDICYGQGTKVVMTAHYEEMKNMCRVLVIFVK